MILDILAHAERYIDIHPGFAKAFAFLRRADIGTLSAGKLTIEGDDIFALVQKDPGKLKQDARLESHNDYIDIQFLIDGNEEAGWKPREDCRKTLTPYKPEKDIAFFSDAPQTFLSFRPDMFAIYFPGDAHAPMISNGTVHKCVVKVRVAGR